MKKVFKYELKREYVTTLHEENLKYPYQVAKFLEIIGLHKFDHERLICLHLDTKGQVIGYHTVSEGILNQTITDNRKVFRVALINNAARIILAHNHPSGDVTPSLKDKATYDSIKDAGEIIQIPLLDMIIVGEKEGVFVYKSLEESRGTI